MECIDKSGNFKDSKDGAHSVNKKGWFNHVNQHKDEGSKGKEKVESSNCYMCGENDHI